MVECIQNHTPGVLIIDEISRAAEVQAALTCKERGVRVVASAHGNLAGLVRNAQLCDLVGGVDVVTISDEYARQDAQRHHHHHNPATGGGSPPMENVSKLRAQRRGPPIFDVVIELTRDNRHEWQVVLHTASAVDSILAHGHYAAQIRNRKDSNEGGGPITVRNVQHEAYIDDRILKEASMYESTLHRLPSSHHHHHQYDSSSSRRRYFEKDAPPAVRHSFAAQTSCPVCSQQFASRRAMLNHATAKKDCRRALDNRTKKRFKKELRF